MGWIPTSTASPLTTKGDVWGYSTTDARIPIGSNGQVLTADSAQTLGLKWAAIPSGSAPTLAYKTADESVTSSTTMQDDDHLSFAVSASDVWVVQCFLRMDAATAGDFKAGFSAPSGATGWAAVLGSGISSSTFSDTAMDNQSGSLGTGGFAGGVGANNETLVTVVGYVVIDATGGTVTLQWAQRVSSGTATRLQEGSFLIAHKVA